MRSTWFCPLTRCGSMLLWLWSTNMYSCVWWWFLIVVAFFFQSCTSYLHLSLDHILLSSILLSFSVVKSTSGGRNHLKSHARAAFCCVKTRTTRRRRVFGAACSNSSTLQTATDRQTDKQIDKTGRHSPQSGNWDKVCKLSTNIDRTFCLIITKRSLA